MERSALNYGTIISEAFRISLRNPFLWFFGFFVSATSFGLNLPRDFGNQRTYSGLPASMERWISDNLVLFLVLASAALVLLVAVSLVFSAISQGALVESVAALNGGEERGFSSAWRTGLLHFWRVLGLALLVFLISLGFLLVIGLPAGLAIWAVFAAAESVGLKILFVFFVGLLALVLSVLLFVPLYIIWQLALRELVVAGEGGKVSLRSGYRLFRRNIGRGLLTWLIQVVLAIGVGVVVAIVGSVYGLLLFGAVAAVGALNSAITTVAATAIALLLFFAVAAVVSGILGTFFSGYWTLSYLRLRRESDDYVSAGSG